MKIPPVDPNQVCLIALADLWERDARELIDGSKPELRPIGRRLLRQAITMRKNLPGLRRVQSRLP